MYDDLPKTRAEAIAAGTPRYFTGVACQRGHVAPRRATGRRCLVCDSEATARFRAANPDANRTGSRRWRENHPDRARRLRIQREAANPHRVQAQRRAARGQPEPTRPRPLICECCAGEDKHMSLDHCHISGAFRGWMCRKCNAGIGLLGDNLAGLLRAVEYLRKNDPTAFLDEAP